MIVSGSPWWLTTSFRKWLATVCASVLHNGTSTTILLNLIHAHHDGSVPIVFWKLHYKVNVDLFPWHHWYFQRLVQSCQFPGICFEELALLAFLTIHSYCVGHPWPIKLLPYHLLSMLLAEMSSGIMVFIKNGGDQTFWYVQSPFEGKEFSYRVVYGTVVRMCTTG